VSLTFGVVSFVLVYLICIPLGILKALHHGSWFDAWSSGIIFLLYSIPPFAFAIVLVVLFCGGSYWNLFPIEGFKSDDFAQLSLGGKILDIAHHMFLPLLCYVIGLFAMLTMLMKNSMLDQLKQDYIRTARAKGLEEKWVVGRHALRNALIPIANGFGQWVSVFFAGSLLIETIFSLRGIGLLSYESIVQRDYPIVLANILILSVLYILGNLLSDLLYVVIDPRIDYR
jgi:microcin C transport system permease protein